MGSALIALVVTIWLMCGVLAYGGLFAYLQQRYTALTESW